jgi:TRAP-type C4-dicarboxylate transport system substrate-binding protein
VSDRRKATGRTARALTTAAALAALAAPATGREVFKVATLAPQGSVWDTSLREMGATWTRDTAGGVELRVYPGGVAGDESDVVRKMRIGQFQGAALTSTGLSEIDPAFQVFAIPMFFESWDEVHHVLEALRPELERRLAARGYVLVLWGHGGWVHLFSRQPIRTLDDLKKQKLFVWAGDDALVQRWRQQGYQPVALAATDVTMGFQTGMLDVIPTTPIAALSLQWFRQTPYMQGLGLAPLVGGVVIQRAAWEKVPEAEREKLAAAALAAQGKLAVEVPRQDDQAIAQMKTRGLTVVEVDEAQKMIWRRAADDFAGRDGQSAAPPEVLAATRAALAAFRAGKGAAR